MTLALRRRLQLGLGGVLLLLVTGCGPNPGLEVGLRHQGVPVLFGLPTPSAAYTPTSQPLAGELVPNFPAPLTAPPPPFVVVSTPPPTLTPTAIPCPTPSPVTFPKETASTSATRPPAAGSYAFRYTGTQTFNPGAANQTVKGLPATGTSQVKNISAPASDGHYTFDVAESYNDMTTTTTYLVEPNNTTSAQPLQTMQAGLYLSAQVTVDSSGTSKFQPQPPVELMPFPANPGTQFQSAGVDPLSQQAMNEESPGGGQVGSTERVPACGAVVDAWHVEIVGQIVGGGGGTTTNFDEIFDVATQYGGLVVAERLKESGTDQKSGQPYAYDVTKTIDTVPQDASTT